MTVYFNYWCSTSLLRYLTTVCPNNNDIYRQYSSLSAKCFDFWGGQIIFTLSWTDQPQHENLWQMMFLTFVTASVQFSCENPHIVMFLQLLPEPENPFKSCSDGGSLSCQQYSMDFNFFSHQALWDFRQVGSFELSLTFLRLFLSSIMV